MCLFCLLLTFIESYVLKILQKCFYSELKSIFSRTLTILFDTQLLKLRKKIAVLIAFILVSLGSSTAQMNQASKLSKQYSDLKSKYTVLGDVKFSGVVRMTSYYRNMAVPYSDLASSSKQFSFSPYPVDLAEASDGANRGQPLLELALEGSPTENAYFKVAYSFNHSFLGLGGDSSRQQYIRQFLKFQAGAQTKIGNIDLVAGGGSNWVSLSTLTFSRRDFRIEPFEKIPWDWYTNSVKKYSDYYSRPTIRTDERFGRTAVQGISIDITEMPGNFGAKLFYGKTARNAFSPFVDFPFNTAAGRLENHISKAQTIGVNYYNQFGRTSRAQGELDARQIVTFDYKVRRDDFYLDAEFGGGGIINPLTDNAWQTGEAIHLNARFSRALTKVPLDLQFYSIDLNVVSQESSAFNSNIRAQSGGFLRTAEFDGQMHVNILQESDMISNNRIGGKLKVSEDFGNLKVELGNAMSIEQENLFDTITIQHRVNSFTRSRFNPFGSFTGPYSRLRNRFMRTFETLQVTDSVSDYRKGFNTADLTLKYKIGNNRKQLILVNYAMAGSVGEGFSPIPLFNTEAFYRQFYNEFSAYFFLNKKTVLLGFASVERLIGNERTNLSPENGKPVNQTGTGFGLGVDWDFMRNGGLFIRHKWFAHNDSNFVLDKFRGQETSVEIKIFF